MHKIVRWRSRRCVLAPLSRHDCVARHAALHATPHGAGHLNEACELRLLVRLGQRIAADRTGETALRADRELAEWNRLLEQRVQEQVAQVERLGRLKRFFSAQVAELILTGEAEDPLKTHRREVTVVFIDLRGFTAFAETAEPEELMAVLREYHKAVGEIIVAHEGTVERFAGDAIMVFFNDPVVVPNPPSSLRTARAGVA